MALLDCIRLVRKVLLYNVVSIDLSIYQSYQFPNNFSFIFVFGTFITVINVVKIYPHVQAVGLARF